jgi:hypothetical protein
MTQDKESNFYNKNGSKVKNCKKSNKFQSVIKIMMQESLLKEKDML